MGLLDGKVALITGGGGGLGEAYARLFAREGAAVVVNDLGGPRDGSGADKSMAEKVVEAIRAEGGRAIANGADISTIEGGQAVFDDAISNFGRADILVNNAGILRDQTFAKASEADWDKVIKVHLKGAFCATFGSAIAHPSPAPAPGLANARPDPAGSGRTLINPLKFHKPAAVWS